MMMANIKALLIVALVFALIAAVFWMYLA